jgi:hypothetical protein
MINSHGNRICALSVALLALVPSCKKGSSWPKLRDGHCEAISQLKVIVDENVASVGHSLSRLEVPAPSATEADKSVFSSNCSNLRRDVREIAKYIDGFVAASRAIVDSRPEGDLASAGLSERFEVSMVSSGLEIFRGCSEDITPKAALDDLQKNSSEVDASLDDALRKCSAAGWQSSPERHAKPSEGVPLGSAGPSPQR